MGSDKMQAEVMEAIQKNLPAQVVGVLKNELADLERLRGVDIELENTKLELAKETSNRKAADEIAARWAKREADLVAREKAVVDAEIRQENTILKIKLEEAERRATIGQEIVRDVFKNRSIVETQTFNYTNGGHPTWGPNGGPPATPAMTGSNKVTSES